MRSMRNVGLWLIFCCLLLTGCGGDDSTKREKTPEKPDGPPTRAEVVVEPSQQTLVIDGEPREAVALVRELLADKSIVYPASAQLTIDDRFEPVTRVRLWVDVVPIDSEVDPETVKELATQTYDALAAAFNQRAEAALRGELTAADQLFEQARMRVSELQAQASAYIQSQQGLPATDESRKQRRYFDVMMQRALDEQIALEKTIEKLKRQIDRGQFVVLQRIR